MEELVPQLEDLQFESDASLGYSSETNESLHFLSPHSSESSKSDHDGEDPIPQCQGLQRCDWLNKEVDLLNTSGVAIAKGICKLSSPLDAVDTSVLGVHDVGVIIMNSLDILQVPLNWVFSLQRWSAKFVLYDGVSLCDQQRKFSHNLKNSDQPPRRFGVQKYDSSRVCRAHTTNRSNKKSKAVTPASILQVAANLCCKKHCTKFFPSSSVEALRKEFWGAEHKLRTKLLLDVHRQVHYGESGQKVVTLEGIDVCMLGWQFIYGVSRSTFYGYKKLASTGKRASNHGNLGTRKARVSTLQATATLQCIMDSRADQMPHKMRTLEDGHHAVEKVLPAGTKWKELLKEVNSSTSSLCSHPVSYSNLTAVRRKKFPAYVIKRRGDNFARCGTCDKKKQLRDSQPLMSEAYQHYSDQLTTHINDQWAHRQAYYKDKYLSERVKGEHLTIIHDKMDHAKTASPCFASKTKATESFMRLPVAVTGMIAHGHVDKNYAHYSLDLYPADSNHTIGSFAKLLRDLELPPTSTSLSLFQNSGTTPLHQAILLGKEVCLSALPLVPDIPAIEAKSLPPQLHVQLDNCWKDNKSRFVFCFWSLLVAKGIFREVTVSFLLVGHTHDDIDASFGRWSMKLKENNYPTVPLLMKSYMELESVPVIPHLIEEVPDFKDFIKNYIAEGVFALVGHTKGQQF